VAISVELIPVSVASGASPQVVAFQPDGTWLKAPLASSPTATAKALVKLLPAHVQFVLGERGTVPEAVAFKEDRKNPADVTLVYSIPIPMPLAEGAGWVALLDPATKHKEAKRRGDAAVHRHVFRAGTLLEYWAERLEEQSALIAFLPRYFTARQARDVYNAFWGYEQDADRFASWSGIGLGKNDGALSPYAEQQELENDDLVETIAETLQRAHTAIHGTDLAASRAFTLALRSSDGMVGIDPDFDAGDTSLGPVLAAAAALVAYQQLLRGPKPTWFRRIDGPIEHHDKLTKLWATRPTWIYPGQDNT